MFVFAKAIELLHLLKGYGAELPFAPGKGGRRHSARGGPGRPACGPGPLTAAKGKRRAESSRGFFRGAASFEPSLEEVIEIHSCVLPTDRTCVQAVPAKQLDTCVRVPAKQLDAPDTV